MGFPKRLLAEHEKLILDLKQHWIAIVPAFLWTVVLAGAWVAAYSVAGDRVSNPENVQIAAAVVALLAWAFLALVPFLRWHSTRFVLTSDRLITRSGILAKHSKEIPLERINNVAFNQTVMERIIGSGDLLIESAGERGQSRITNVRKPEQVQLMIYKEAEANNNRMMRRETQAPPSIPDQIEALARLAQQGVISEDEFEKKKEELLRRL